MRSTFFAPRAHIDFVLGGAYELLWSGDDEVAPGSQGSERCRVLSYLPGEMLSFEWNAPPEFPGVRGTPTFVVVFLADAEPGAQCPAVPRADEPMALQLVQRTPGVSTGGYDRRKEACVEASTLVRLSHLGWRDGEEWDKAYEYFEQRLVDGADPFARALRTWADRLGGSRTTRRSALAPEAARGRRPPAWAQARRTAAAGAAGHAARVAASRRSPRGDGTQVPFSAADVGGGAWRVWWPPTR